MPEQPLSGQLLLATPGLRDPNFARTVILVLAHNQDGTLGVVLNRPGTLGVEEVLPDWAPLAAPPGVVYLGGPVDPSAVLCLGSTSDGWRVVDVTTREGNEDLTRIRLFAAYAGWSSGQLEAELEAGGWFVVDALPGDPFTSHVEDMWQRVLRRQGGRMAFASTYPLDPTHN